MYPMNRIYFFKLVNCEKYLFMKTQKNKVNGRIQHKAYVKSFTTEISVSIYLPDNWSGK